MSTTVVTSKLFRLQWNDFWKGLVVATLTAPLTIIQNSFAAGTFTVDWKNVDVVALSGLTGYLLKNFFTNQQAVVKNIDPDATTTVTIPPKEDGSKVVPIVNVKPAS